MDVAVKWDSLPLTRQRAVVDLLLTVTVLRTTPGARVNPQVRPGGGASLRLARRTGTADRGRFGRAGLSGIATFPE